MKRYLLVVAFTLYTTYIFAQPSVIKFDSPISPSPTAASLGKYGDIPTNNYTGVPQISVPIYDIKIGSNVIPVNLSYHAGGFKISDESSWVGLGWSLNAGGVITRTKKMIDDLSPKGYFKTSNHSTIGDGSDKQQDMFYFNFLNFSGKFVIDYSSVSAQPYSINIIGSYDDDNLKINLVNNTTWTITDKYGVIYQFNVTEMTNEKVVSQGTYSGSSNTVDYISSWYLSKIIYTSGEEVVLNYNNGAEVEAQPIIDYIAITKTGHSSSAPINCYNPISFGTDYTTTTHTAKVSTKILNEIVFFGGKLSFNSVLDRIDLKCSTPAARLGSIQVYSQTTASYALLKTFQLTQSYFSSSSRENNLSKRLKLDAFIQVGTLSQSPEYKFYYNDLLLPDKDSKDMDHWGYYNGPNNNLSLFPSGNNRKPSANYVKAGLLSTMSYPTNGATQFVFEINDFSNLGNSLDWTSANSGNTGMLGSGVRIQKITNLKKIYSSDSDTYNITQFEYVKNVNGVVSSSGKIMSKVNYYTTSQTISSVPYLGQGDCSKYTGTPVIFYSREEYASSSIPISGDAQGNTIGYDNVKIKQVGLSGASNTTVENFMNSSTASLAASPMVPSTNSNTNGLLVSRTLNVVNNGVESPVKKFEYEYSTQSSFTNPNYIMFFNPGGNLTTASYNIAIEWITLIKTIEKDYKPGITTEYFVKKTDVIYNSTNRQKKQEDFTDSKNNIYSNKYLYPSDMVSQGITNPYQAMVNRNMIAYVVQVQKNKGSVLLGKTYTDYLSGWSSNADLILPSTIRSQFMSDPPEIRLNYGAYDSKGNLLTVYYEKGIKNSFLWSYDGHYPIAEIKNASYAELETVLGASNIASFANQHNPTTAMIDNFLAPLKASLPNTQITSYYYQPLVGLIKQKDIKDLSIYYEYDDLQRLKYIKDDQGNIIKSFKYHFFELQGPITISELYTPPTSLIGYLSKL